MRRRDLTLVDSQVAIPVHLRSSEPRILPHELLKLGDRKRETGESRPPRAESPRTGDVVNQ